MKKAYGFVNTYPKFLTITLSFYSSMKLLHIQLRETCDVTHGFFNSSLYDMRNMGLRNSLELGSIDGPGYVRVGQNLLHFL